MLFSQYFSHYEILVPFHIGEGALECQLPIIFSENKKSEILPLPALKAGNIYLKFNHLMTKPTMWCAPSEDSDQPGHPPSLIRVFAVRIKKAWVLSYALSAQRRLWSDWADAQADLSLRWAHMPFRPVWSESSLGAHAILLVLSWGGSLVSSTILGMGRTNEAVKFNEKHC